MYPEAPTTQNFASCVQLCRWRSAWVARARRLGSSAASRCSMTVREPSDSGGRPAARRELHPLVERDPDTALEQDCDNPPARFQHNVSQQPDLSSCSGDGSPAQRAECESAGAVEVELVLLEQHEWGVDRERAARDRGRRQRQEPVHFVAAAHVEADGAQSRAVEQQVDRPAELDPVQAHGQSEHLVSRKLRHALAILPGPGAQKPSSPTSGTKRHGTDLITAGPSGLHTITSSRWIPCRPTGTTSRPRSASWSYRVCGRRGAAAATAIASNGARSGRPRVPSPTCTRTRS